MPEVGGMSKSKSSSTASTTKARSNISLSKLSDILGVQETPLTTQRCTQHTQDKILTLQRVWSNFWRQATHSLKLQQFQEICVSCQLLVLG